jgi:predicted Fe-Mo cluster-binding NifX family protein
MIAIPVKTNKENPAVSTLFGKAKWFAFIDGDKITVEKNELQGGRAVVEDFISRRVTQLVFSSMGGNPFMLLQKAEIECFYSGENRILLSDVLAKLRNNELININATNMSDYIEQGGMHKSHDHEGTHTQNHDHNH